MEDWNASSDGPQSPKKKLHLKSKGGSLQEQVNDVRNGLKLAKDISARNLLAGCGGSDSEATESEEQVMMIEEEGTDFVSEAEEEIIEEEYYEEVIDDESDSDDSILEPLPPPIKIPKALKVKDSECEDDSVDEKSDASYEEEEEEEEYDDVEMEDTVAASTGEAKSGSPLTSISTIEPDRTYDDEPAKPKRAAVRSPLRPSTYRGLSFEEKPNGPPPTVTDVETSCEPSPSLVSPGPKTPPQTASPLVVQAATFSTPPSSMDDDGRPDVAWKKPDWTKNTNLRTTGKSAAGNLAKPITNLPHMGKNYDKADPMRSETLTTALLKDDSKPVITSCRTPTQAPKPKASVSAPKSAPQVRKPKAPSVVSTTKSRADDFSAPKIEWEKPDWTKKKVLKETAKSYLIKTGQKLERPIGGIKPVD